jgi:hypothetical protein
MFQFKVDPVFDCYLFGAVVPLVVGVGAYNNIDATIKWFNCVSVGYKFINS